MFVSSTFRDMHAEREELVKRVFPQLRELCERRGVAWGEVDLRWGITEAQQARGEVLPICLAEIEECRPYFLGLLGERYGSVPERIDPAVIAREPWIREHAERSVTELEIVFGVLRDPEMAEHALFYFRDPAYAQADPSLREAPTEDEVRQLGPAEAEARAQGRREKLAALKAQIRASGLPLHENYRDPVQLGELVLADLTAVIDRVFPAGSEPTPAERERALHEEFARARAEVYIARDRDLERLDRHVAGTGKPLVLVGESGVGKSALLANWALRWRAREEGVLAMHFAAASPGSRDWMGMLRRIIGDLDAGFGLGIEAPDDREELRNAFATALEAAAERGRFVLVMDALDQLEDRDGAPDLAWLPATPPTNARVMLSTLPGRPLSELRRRGWRTTRVRPLRRREREQLIVGYLSQYAKTLPPRTVRQVAAARPAANPLFVRALLEELRVYGDHLTVERRASELLAAAGRRSRAHEAIPRLYDQILGRWETDFDRDRPDLVWDALALIASARRGLTESELLELLGDASGPLPHAYWSPLRLAAKQALAEHGGLLTFSHDYFRQAVADRYLVEAEEQSGHARLARYFARRPRTATRTLEELPWQLREAGAWEELYDVLADPGFRDALGESRDYELTGYWLSLERHRRGGGAVRGILDAYEPVLRAPEAQDGAVVDRVAKLLADTGHGTHALGLYEHLARKYVDDGDRAGLQAVAGRRADILRAAGDLDDAYRLYEQQENICRAIDNPHGLQSALGGRARVLLARGDLERATTLVREREGFCRDVGDYDGLAAALGDDAIIQRMRGDLDAALDRHAEEERVGRQAGNPRLVARALNGQAAILVARGKLRRADGLLAEWRRTWWDFANDSDRGRWQVAVNLTTANRRVLFYLKLAIILLAGFVPIAIASIQIGTQTETVSNRVLSNFLVVALLVSLAVIGFCVYQAAAWRWRLVRARSHYRASEVRSEVGPQGPYPVAAMPSLLRVPDAQPAALKAVQLKAQAAVSKQTEAILAVAALVVGSLLAGISVHHLLGTTLPCYHVASNVAPCSGAFGWYFAMLLAGLVLVVLGGLVVEGSVTFPIFLGTIGVGSLIAGLGSPAVGITKSFPIAFGVSALVAGLTLGTSFWLTARR